MNKVLLQIDACRNNGSTGRINEQIGLLAEKNGWDCYIAHGARYVNPSKLKSIQVVTKFEEYWHALETKIFDNHGLSSRFATWRFIRKIKKIKPTVVHLHTIHGYYINYKILFKYLVKENIPVVWTLHDCWNFTGHCGYFDYQDCSRWKLGCYDCPLKGSYPASSLFDRSKQNYIDKKKCFTSINNMILIPVSDWLGSFLKDSFLKNIPICRIYNGVNIDVFKPRVITDSLRNKFGIESSKILLMGCATGFGQRKGYKDFIKLASMLEQNYQILMVGVHESQLNELHAAGIIGITRTESVDELALYYSEADIFLNPTYEDNFPTTNLEALACGTPVITYRTGGSVEAVDEHTGIIVDKGDINGLMNAIYQICNSSDNYKSEYCRDRAVRLYNKDERFKDYVELYNKIIDNNK